jgi:hypothetical protein
VNPVSRFIRWGNTPQPLRTPRARRSRAMRPYQVIMLLTGLLLAGALISIASDLHSRLNSAAPDISAIQVIQVYTESLYRAVIAIGIGIAVYIFAHAFDD